MDEHVLRGMARWPDVPAVYGWLSLDRRGNWLLKGDPISNAIVTSYIGRNYERDAQGRWFFQNGPQRVYVELEYTPLVYRVVSGSAEPLAIESHTGRRAFALSGAWIDETGALIIETEHGIGVLDDRDLDAALPALVDANGIALPEDALEEAFTSLQDGRDAPVPVRLTLGESSARLQAIRSSHVPVRFGYTQHPASAPGLEAIASAR